MNSAMRLVVSPSCHQKRGVELAHIGEKHNLELIAIGIPVNPAYLWVTRRPTDPKLERIKLVALRHLGIRPAWIDSWEHIRHGLINLAAM